MIYRICITIVLLAAISWPLRSTAADGDQTSLTEACYRWDGDQVVTRCGAGYGHRQNVSPSVSTRPDRDPCTDPSQVVFSAQTEYPVNTGQTRFIGTPDLNADGFPDLVVLYHPVHMDVYLNGGDGTFDLQYTVPVPPPGAISNHAVADDANGDGHLDLLISNDSSHESERGLLVLYGDGQGGFPTDAFFPSTYAVNRSELIDLDGDDDLDVVIATQATQINNAGIFVWFINEGGGEYTGYWQYIGPHGFFPMHMALLPPEEPAHILIGGYDWYTWCGHLLIMDPATLTIIDTITCPGFRFENIALGDINGDGAPDLVSTMAFAYNLVLVMLSGGQMPEFQVPVIHELETTFGMITTADLIAEPAYDPPGAMVAEVIVATLSLNDPLDQIAYVYRYTECDSFSQPLAVGDPGGNRSGFDVETADLNGDGALDLLTTTNYTNNPRDLAVLLNEPPSLPMTEVSIQLQAGQVHLYWPPLPEAVAYEVYRQATAYADTSEAELISIQTATTYQEPVSGTTEWYYFVVAQLGR